MRSIFYVLFFLLFFNESPAQILSDPQAKQQLLAGLDKLYNFQFAEGTAIFNKVKIKYNNHPALHLLAAMQLEMQYPAFESDPKLKAIYLANLEKCIETATPQLKNAATASEATFFLLAAHGYKTLSFNYDKDYVKAANEARKAYGYLKDGFELKQENPEFYFSTGLYNYYLIQYPVVHPIIKPLMVFFSGGNKKTGISQLETSIKTAVFTKNESMVHLIGVLLKYENNPSLALAYSKTLAERYPNNFSFLMKYAETLTLSGKHKDASEQLLKLKKNTNIVYQTAANVLEGIISEKTEKDDKKASVLYNATLAQPYDERNTVNYHAMAYAGLARIALRSKNVKLAKQHYQKCNAIAEYEFLKTESKGFL